MAPIGIEILGPVMAAFVAFLVNLALGLRAASTTDQPRFLVSKRLLAYSVSTVAAFMAAYFSILSIFTIAEYCGMTLSYHPGAAAWLGGPPLWLEWTTGGICTLAGVAASRVVFHTIRRAKWGQQDSTE